jgi:hypothetical protein
VNIDGLFRKPGLERLAELAQTGGLPNPDPIVGLVTSAAVLLGVDKGLNQMNRMVVLMLPILGQTMTV